jgi:hypothetical protein
MEEPLSIEITTKTLDHGKSRISGYFTVTIKYDTEGHYLGVETEEATPAPGKARLPHDVLKEIHNAVEHTSGALPKENAKYYAHLFSNAVFVINKYQGLNVLRTREPVETVYLNGATDYTITYCVDGWA